MTTALILRHLKDTRRQSVKIWSGIPPEKYLWKTDEDARHFLAVIRHTLKADKWFHYIIENRGDINDYSVFNDDRPYTDVETEIAYHETSTQAFWDYIASFSNEEMERIEIFRTDKKGAEWARKLGDYLLRVAYHEATHAGQLLANMRQAGIKRPYIWDDEDGVEY